MTKPLTETTVLVTGASRGIGAAIAVRFASVGMRVVIHYLQAHEAANEVARQCLSYGADVLTVTADLRSKEQLERMAEKMERHGFIPDVLVNNAGVAQYGLLSEVTEEEWDYVMGVNLKGMFLCTQRFMPAMIRQKYGRIINVSSVWGISGASCEVVYSASKGGVNAFTKALAKELAPSGVTVNAVAPGSVPTPGALKYVDQKEYERRAATIPLRRIGREEDIDHALAFLLSKEASFVNGAVLHVDGGIVAAG